MNSLLFLFFSFGVFQTLSKAGIICYLVFIPAFLIFQVIKLKNYKIIGALSILILFFGSYLTFSSSLLAVRFRKIPEVFENVKLQNNPSTESNISRLLMWNSSWEVIKKNPIFGTGTGDYDDELTRMSKSLGNTGVAEKRYNSHNQFLNTFVQLGIIGFLILLGNFIFSLFHASIESNWLAFFIFSTFFVNFLFESFLETQAGIVLFCVFVVVLNSNNLNNIKSIRN
jgi:O-antigen ligase